MFKKIFIRMFCKPCDHCNEKKWDMVIERKKTFRGIMVKRTCRDCKRKMERTRMEKLILNSIEIATRKDWF